MRFIPEKMASIIIGLIIMPVMVMSIPIIVLAQKMPYESPQFWAVWRDTLGSTVPYAVPLAVCTAIIARLIVGRFTVKAI
ncbi:MAG: hypothetical protein COC24_010625 [Alphaproteobacteria bacterium]|nr:hypothetical protein [Alphaproteobacteria bacterium]